jgi:hypothetical protein
LEAYIAESANWKLRLAGSSSHAFLLFVIKDGRDPGIDLGAHSSSTDFLLFQAVE